MAGLQRFITYIYKYENDEKKENAGFAKVEIRGSVCRVEVHIRNINMEQPESTVYLFARKADLMQGIPVGSIAVSRGNGDVRYAFELKELLGFGVTMNEMEGIFIPFGESRYLASQWKEGTIEKRRFHIIEKKEPQEREKILEREKLVSDQTTQTELTQIAQQQVTSEAAESAPDQSTSQSEEVIPTAQTNAQVPSESGARKETQLEGVQPEGAQPEEIPSEKAQREETQNKERALHATELPLEEFFEERGWEGIFQKLRLKLDIFYPFEGKEIECVRMQLKDIQELPKKYWYIGNNSFLLHGFFNYKHIILGELTENEKKEYFIGVPGVFQNQERIMAAMFGFPEFCTAKNAEYKTGNFGYWYRII